MSLTLVEKNVCVCVCMSLCQFDIHARTKVHYQWDRRLPTEDCSFEVTVLLKTG